MTELADGRVLIIGGAMIGADEAPTEIHSSFEVFDPSKSHFKSLGQLREPRAWHTATRISPTQVLVVGGINAVTADGVSVSSTAEIIDVSGAVPVVTVLSGVFDTGAERYRHAAARLSDGTVLIAGGIGPGGGPLDSTYRYFPSPTTDPAGSVFVQQGRLAEARSLHTLTALVRGHEPAVVVGGLGEAGALASVEVFTTNPQQGGCLNDQTPSQRVGCWIRPTGRVLQRARFGHAAVVVGDRGEKVLFVGGYATEDRQTLARELELLDERLEIEPGGDVLEFGRGEVAAAALADGDVLLVGGRTGAHGAHAVATRLRRRIDPDTREFTGFSANDVEPGCDLGEARWGLHALRLTTGTVLIAGGVGFNVMQDSTVASRRAEIYFPRVIDLSTVYPRP
jgi:hypothetical protein